MKVLVLNPGSRRESAAGAYSDSMFPMPPKGVAGIAAVSRVLGHETYADDLYADPRSAAAVAASVAQRSIDVLGLGVLAPNMPEVESIVRAVRRARPETHICLGNTYASYLAGDLMERLPIDSVVRDEGEHTFGALVSALDAGSPLSGISGLVHRENGRVADNGPRPQIDDLDALPFPAWDLLPIQRYVAPPRLVFKQRVLALEAARGCPWKCTYCSQILTAPSVRRRSLSSVVDEMEWAMSEFGVTHFGFVDTIFPMTKSAGFEFARLVRERGLEGRVRWFSTTRADLVSPELLRDMKASGCVFVLYGFETAAERHLSEAQKRLDPRAAFDAVRMTRDAGILSYGVFMIGFPGETREEARATIRYSKEINCDLASFSRVTPYPGTPLYEQHRASFPGRTPPQQWNNQYRPERGERMWALPGLTPTEIDALLREAMIAFYLRPWTLARHLRLGTFKLGDLVRGAGYLVRDAVARIKAGMSSRRAGVAIGEDA